MARNNSMVIKIIARDNQVWTIMHNKIENKEYYSDKLDLIREWPDSECTIGIDFIEEGFYNVKQCRDYINNWHKENPIKED